MRNVALLSGGTAFAQGLAVFVLPILTRLYTPEDFDLLAIYVATVGILTVVSCLRFDIAIPLATDDADGMALLFISLAFAAVTSLLLTVLVLVFPDFATSLVGIPIKTSWLYMVPAGVFFASVYNALQYWSSRQRRFGLITQTRLTRATGGATSQMLAGFISPSPFGLLFGHMIYSGLGVWGLIKNTLRNDRHAIKSLSFNSVLEVIIKFQRFPRWSVPEALFNTLGVQLPIILIAANAIGPEAGFLIISLRVMSLPMALIGSSVAQVFIAEAPLRHEEGSLRSFTVQTLWTLAKIGGPPLVLIGAFSPLLFPIVFGPDWERSGWLVMWMTPCCLLQFLASPVSMALHIANKSRLAMIMQLLGLIIRVAPMLFFASILSHRLGELYALCGALFYAVYLGSIFLRLCLKPHQKKVDQPHWYKGSLCRAHAQSISLIS